MMDQESKTIHNSTFSGSKSLRSVEDSFNPTKMKEVVEDLIMSKYGSRFQKNILKSTSRRLKRKMCSYSSSNNCENPQRSASVKITTEESDLSIGTSDVSDLISFARPDTTSEVETDNNMEMHSDTCTIDTTSTEQINTTSSDEEENEETSDDKSTDLRLESLSSKLQDVDIFKV